MRLLMGAINAVLPVVAIGIEGKAVRVFRVEAGTFFNKVDCRLPITAAGESDYRRDAVGEGFDVGAGFEKIAADGVGEERVSSVVPGVGIRPGGE